MLEDVIQRLRQEGPAMPVESFQRLVVTARSVAITGPSNLIKFAESGSKVEGKKSLAQPVGNCWMEGIMGSN